MPITCHILGFKALSSRSFEYPIGIYANLEREGEIIPKSDEAEHLALIHRFGNWDARFLFIGGVIDFLEQSDFSL